MGLTERQKVIVDIAAQMIAQNGYRETSMRDIAARLGVKAASIYSHFESKDHLLQVILGVFSDELEKVMQEVSAVEPVEKKRSDQEWTESRIYLKDLHQHYLKLSKSRLTSKNIYCIIL